MTTVRWSSGEKSCAFVCVCSAVGEGFGEGRWVRDDPVSKVKPMTITLKGSAVTRGAITHRLPPSPLLLSKSLPISRRTDMDETPMQRTSSELLTLGVTDDLKEAVC